MSLQVWLPLNKNTIENKGLSDVTFINTSGTFVNSGIESCYSFSGYIDTGIYYMDNTFMNIYINHHSFSLCGWFKTSETSRWTPLMYLSYGLSVRVGAENVFSLSNATETVECNANVTTCDNKWHHICGTYDISDNMIRIYIDGQLKNTVSFVSGKTYASSWNNGLYIGRNPNDSQPNASYYFQGSLSDIRIYDHALSDKEVAELAKGLMFHLKLDNTDLYDCSGYGWDVSKYSSGTLTENTDTARYGKSLTFDNTAIRCTDVIPSGIEEFTIATLFYANPISGHENTMCIWNGRSVTGSAVGIFYLGGGIRFDDEHQLQSSTITANKWNHIVCTYTKGGHKKIYINGVVDKDILSGTVNKSNTLASIGMSSYQDSTPSGNVLNGSISDFRIYRTALTDEQVRELYKVGGSIDNHGNAHCYELSEGPSYDDRLRFESVGNSTIGLSAKSSYQTIEYSKDYSTWTTMDTTTTISLTDKEVVYLRGILSADNTRYSNYTNFTMTGAIKGYGNINYLWNYQNLSAPLKKYCGHQLFISCSGLLLPPDLPATELAEGCYEHMFQTCVNLLAFPELPAKTLVTNCYHSMFWRGGDANGQKANYLKCLATSGINANNSTNTWFGTGAATAGTFVKDANATWPTETSGIPSGWSVQNE